MVSYIYIISLDRDDPWEEGKGINWHRLNRADLIFDMRAVAVLQAACIGLFQVQNENVLALSLRQIFGLSLCIECIFGKFFSTQLGASIEKTPSGEHFRSSASC